MKKSTWINLWVTSATVLTAVATIACDTGLWKIQK